MEPNKFWLPEFDDYFEVFEFGAEKHGINNWLEPNGKKSSWDEMHNSIFHHLAQSYAAGIHGNPVDHESGLHPLLHAKTRIDMTYTRIKRNLFIN